MLLIGAFEKYTKKFLFAKLREMSDLCKPLPNQPGKELAPKIPPLYIPLELCCFYSAIFLQWFLRLSL